MDIEEILFGFAMYGLFFMLCHMLSNWAFRFGCNSWLKLKSDEIEQIKGKLSVYSVSSLIQSAGCIAVGIWVVPYLRHDQFYLMPIMLLCVATVLGFGLNAIEYRKHGMMFIFGASGVYALTALIMGAWIAFLIKLVFDG